MQLIKQKQQQFSYWYCVQGELFSIKINKMNTQVLGLGSYLNCESELSKLQMYKIIQITYVWLYFSVYYKDVYAGDNCFNWKSS